MRVIRWKNAVTGVESLNITATGIYFPVGKTDSSFIARYSMASAGQTASVERVSSPNGSRVGSPAINVSGTTEVVVNERRGLSTGIIVTAISGTLISVLDDNTPITDFPDTGLGRFPAKEDADAYVYGSTVPQGIPATINGVPYSWGGAGAGWVGIISGIKSRRVAAFGTSVGFGQYMVSTNDSANAPTMWMPATAYTVGQFIYPRYAELIGGFRKTTLRCSVSGTTGIIEPDWDFAEKATTIDGTAIFEAVTTNVTGCSFARGAWTFAQAIAGQPLDEAYLVGYEGGKFPAIMAYWEKALSASDPGVIFISDLWLNDISVTPFATIRSYWADLADKIAAQTAIGVEVILQTVLPKADIDASGNWTGYVYGDETRAWKWLNDKMRELAETNSSVHLLVVDDIYTDPNPANPVWPENSTTFTSQAGTAQALKFTDGTHPYQNAQWRIARRLATILTSIAPPIDRFAAPGLYAGISMNPANYGTAGGTSTNTSGTVADGYTASGSPNCTVVASKEAVQLATRSKQILALTASGTNATAYMLETAQKSSSELLATDIIQAFAEVEIVANPVNFRAVQLYLGDNVNSGSLAGSTWTVSVNSTDQNMDEVTSNLALTLKTPPQTLGARTTLRTNVQMMMSGTGASTVKIGRRRSA